jgi:hypothetical protein
MEEPNGVTIQETPKDDVNFGNYYLFLGIISPTAYVHVSDIKNNELCLGRYENSM